MKIDKIVPKTTRFLLVAFLFVIHSIVLAQNGIVKGRITEAGGNEPIPFVNVLIQNTTTGSITDFEGFYEIKDLKPGLYNVEASYVGYKTQTVFEVEVTNNKPALVNFELVSNLEKIDEVTIQVQPFKRVEESPLSLRTIGVNEIARYPGGNRDISRVIQSLPGVGSTVSFRNDILIRGGSPAENVFYLDGIEIPSINHFSTQGATGGPVGLLNVDFIREVDFYTGAFPANRGNTLSSVMELKLIDGRDDRPGATFTIGASEVAAAFETPLKDKGTFIFSARRSYLQLLFKAIGLPFLPTFNDFQFKTKLKLNDKNELTILGLGVVDNLVLNKDANETEEQRYLLGNLPENDQYSYTFGLRHRLFLQKSVWTFVASRSMLRNINTKYFNNDDADENNLILKYSSLEAENKLRAENSGRINGWKYTYGANYELARFTNSTFNRIFLPNQGEVLLDFDANLIINKGGLFGQVSRSFFNQRFDVSFGLRTDFNDYNKHMGNPLNQLSPRLSMSYAVTERINVNFNTGIYYQIPSYTLLGFQNNDGEFVNQETLKYINNKQFVLGAEYSTAKNSKFSAEGFLKLYDNYPFLLNDSISFANLGGDFGVVGSEPADASSVGRAYGMELLFQQKFFKGWYGIVSYTLFWSEFKDKNGVFVPSAWDSRHIISLTGGKSFKKNWEIGARWGIFGGAPYTPYDLEASAQIENWDLRGVGIKDFDRLNSERTPWVHQLDIRIDKKWFFEKWNLNLFLDLRNAYNFKATLPPFVTVLRNESGEPVVVQDGAGNDVYSPYILKNISGNLLPSIGVVVKI
jgi:hypothetical protein